MRLHTCSPTLYNPHPPGFPPPCCQRHGLWNTDARKFPALILLTFSVTHRFSAWRHSTHSVRESASVETRLGAPAASLEAAPTLQVSAPPLCQHISELWATFGAYYRLLNQPLVSVIITMHKAAFSAQFSRISSPFLLLIFLKEGRFGPMPHVLTLTVLLPKTNHVFKSQWGNVPKPLRFNTSYIGPDHKACITFFPLFYLCSGH